MQLIGPIAAGIRGAEGGTFRAYVRGTAQDAAIYTDPDGRNQDTALYHALGGFGDGVYYAAQDVEIVAYSAGGAVVRRFVVNNSAANVEYIGPSFTGVDPISAAPGVNRPVSVKAILDLVRARFGSTDFRLQKDTAPTPAVWTPRSLSVSVGTAFFNVKDPTFGATGNGTTNDRAAIQAAIDAAGAAGGGMVIIPPGTYAIGSALMITSRVRIVGFGMPTLLMTSSTASAITATSVNGIELSELNIQLAVSVGMSSSATAVSLTSCADAVIRRVNVLESQTGGYRFFRALALTSCIRATVDTCRLIATDRAVSLSGTSQGNRITNSSMFVNGTNGVALYAANQTMAVTGCGPIEASGTGGRAFDFVASAMQVTGCSEVYGSLYADGASSVREAANAWSSVSMVLTSGAGRVLDVWTTTWFADGGSLASAANVTIPNGGLHRWFEITGTTSIGTLSSDGGSGMHFPHGHIITLRFAASLTVLHNSGNIHLNGAANFTTSAGDTLTLQRIGDRWKEIGRANI